MNFPMRWGARASVYLAVVVVAAWVIGGCPPPDSGDNGDGAGRDIETLVGVWEHEGASILSSLVDGEITFLALNADGTAQLFTRNADTNVLGRHDGVFAVAGAEGLLFDFPSLSEVQLLLVEQADANTLELVDSVGGVSTFARTNAVPDTAQPQTLTVVRRFTGLPTPDSRTGLAFDGTSLWYQQEDSAMIVPVNPGNGVAGAPVTIGFGQFVHVHAMQGADFWTHCGCGDSREAKRRTQTGTDVDTVNTIDLGAQIIIRAIAYDSVGNILWLHGSGRNDNIGRFLRVNSNAEPDLLLGQADFEAFVNALTWDGTNLWAVVGFGGEAVVVRIDPTAFDAVATFDNPDPAIDWFGIAPVGGNLFLLGRNDAGEGVLFEVTP